MKLFVNGKEIEVPASAMEKRIVEFLREDLDLTGAKNACDIGACGACTILVNDEPNRICVKLVKNFAGARKLCQFALQIFHTYRRISPKGLK